MRIQATLSRKGCTPNDHPSLPRTGAPPMVCPPRRAPVLNFAPGFFKHRAQFSLYAAGETEAGADHPRICMTAKKIAPAPAAKGAKPDDTTKKVAKPAAKAVEPAAKVKPGRKAKVEEKAKKSEDNDVDLSDLESDLEGEPEVETAADETKVKAKPLRMKVSRAKERALMREFGLEETALTEEEAAKRRQELKTLIKMGKTRGFLTHQEINDHLPEKLVNDEILEAIVSMLND